MLYMCIEYHIQVYMYHVTVSAQGVDERMINVHYYYYYYIKADIYDLDKASVVSVAFLRDQYKVDIYMI